MLYTRFFSLSLRRVSRTTLFMLPSFFLDSLHRAARTCAAVPHAADCEICSRPLLALCNAVHLKRFFHFAEHALLMLRNVTEIRARARRFEKTKNSPKELVRERETEARKWRKKNQRTLLIWR